MIDPEFSKKCYTILINEVVPRAKKLGLPLKDFLSAEITGLLARLEYEGILTRADVRYMLNERVKVLQKNDNI